MPIFRKKPLFRTLFLFFYEGVLPVLLIGGLVVFLIYCFTSTGINIHIEAGKSEGPPPPPSLVGPR